MTVEDDARVRLHIFQTFVDTGSPPTPQDTAAAMSISEPEAAAAFRRLAEGRAIVLEPGSTDVWMANPLSARPTEFDVRAADGRRWHGVCAWDAPGVLAMIGSEGMVSTSCPDCGEPLELRVENGEMRGPEGAVAHFLVPAKRFWDDIGFT